MPAGSLLYAFTATKESTPEGDANLLLASHHETSLLRLPLGHAPSLLCPATETGYLETRRVAVPVKTNKTTHRKSPVVVQHTPLHTCDNEVGQGYLGRVAPAANDSLLPLRAPKKRVLDRRGRERCAPGVSDRRGEIWSQKRFCTFSG